MNEKHFRTINPFLERKEIRLRLSTEEHGAEGAFLVRVEDSGEERLDFVRRAVRYSLEYSLQRKEG